MHVSRTTAGLAASCPLAISLVAYGGPPPSASDHVTPGAAESAAVEVVMTDNMFTPDVVAVAAGKEVTINVVNDGRVEHNLVVDDLDLSTGSMTIGDRVHATFIVPAGGITFHCTIHPGMKGRITTG